MANAWTVQEAEKHFFIYVQRTGGEDLLHPLGTTLASNSDLQEIETALHSNLQTTARAATVPFYVAHTGTASGSFFAMNHLVEEARQTGNIHSAASLLNKLPHAIVEQVFEALRMLQQAPLVMEAVQALLRQATAMMWGVFEAFTLDLFRLLVNRDLNVLQEIVAGTPRSKMPKELLKHVEKERKQDPTLPMEAMLESFKQTISMNIDSIQQFFGTIFKNDGGVSSSLSAPVLRMLSARRHLLMHRAGVVDQKYVTTSGEALQLGGNLVVSPIDVHQGFRSIVSAASALIRAADARL